PQITRVVGDAPGSRARVEQLISPASIAEIRGKAFGPPEARKKVAALDPELPSHYESAAAATTHFVVADRAGNIVCATQSQSLHFGAGVVPPGTGVVMNNSMSNFTFTERTSLNYIAPGRRPRSTIAPTIVLREGRPDFALGLPGASRIPTAMLQVLIDHLLLDRPLAEAIGDTRLHYSAALRAGETVAFEAERSLPHGESTALQELGWKVNLPEAAGTGKYFGGVNAIVFNRDGTRTGIADPRRTNVALGH
ncbi:MAG: gamma-glutamyltransferase, partial [Opitutaceae bacterium]|nr:gamma-glutamyltransferase [Opitutaceae bacterium]